MKIISKKYFKTRLVFFLAFLFFLYFPVFLSSFSFADTVNYQYDASNRLTGVEYSNGTTIEYSYDAAGNRLSTKVVIRGSDLQPQALAVPAMVPAEEKSKVDGQAIEVKINWFEDILVARVKGLASPQLKKGGAIPSAVVAEIIKSIRVIEYRDGMILGTLMDDRPALAGKIARIVENGDIIERTGGKTTSSTMVIHILLSRLRAVIFSPESTPPPHPKPQPQLSEDTWQSIGKD